MVQLFSWFRNTIAWSVGHCLQFFSLMVCQCLSTPKVSVALDASHATGHTKLNEAAAGFVLSCCKEDELGVQKYLFVFLLKKKRISLKQNNTYLSLVMILCEYSTLRHSSKTKSECIKLMKQKDFILIIKAFFTLQLEPQSDFIK